MAPETFTATPVVAAVDPGPDGEDDCAVSALAVPEETGHVLSALVRMRQCRRTRLRKFDRRSLSRNHAPKTDALGQPGEAVHGGIAEHTEAT